jgi:hypothetical protein
MVQNVWERILHNCTLMFCEVELWCRSKRWQKTFDILYGIYQSVAKQVCAVIVGWRSSACPDHILWLDLIIQPHSKYPLLFNPPHVIQIYRSSWILLFFQLKFQIMFSPPNHQSSKVIEPVLPSGTIHKNYNRCSVSEWQIAEYIIRYG